MSNRKYEIAEKETMGIFDPHELDITGLSSAMDIYAREFGLEYIMWVIETFTTDEGRLPLSGNVHLGGLTIFIDHVEYPFSHTYELFLKSKQ